jgi:hypothetical protein
LAYRRVTLAALTLVLAAPAGSRVQKILTAPESWVLARAMPSAPQNPILSLPDAFSPGQEDDSDFIPQASSGPRQFYFTRAAYTGYYRFRDFRSWSVDFPKADRQFLVGLRRLTNLDAYELENPVRLTDPELGKYPFLYTVEVGYMALTEGEVEGLRRYLRAGGFLVVDDFWGTMEWENFQAQFQRILPGYPIVDIPLTHPIFNCFYDVKEIVQVPNVGQGMQGGPTWESDGYYPEVKGIFDEHGRLMVVVNWNTDLGDAWEWAENPYYPLRFSTYAYQMGVNFIIYAMSH